MELIYMKDSNDAYERAKKRVDTIKGFYNHLKVFLIFNVLLVVAKLSLADWIIEHVPDRDVQYWIDMNIIITPAIWGIGLMIHGIYAYRHKFTFVKRWEEKKLKEIMEEENKDMYE